MRAELGQASEAAPGARAATEASRPTEAGDGLDAHCGGARSEARAAARAGGAASAGDRAGTQGAQGDAVQEAGGASQVQTGGEDRRG